MHPPPFCDACKIAIASDSEGLTIQHRSGTIDLCETCSVVILAMLRDMRALPRK